MSEERRSASVSRRASLAGAGLVSVASVIGVAACSSRRPRWASGSATPLDPNAAAATITVPVHESKDVNNDFGSLVAGETEIWGQRLNAASGAEVGTDDFRISALGPDGDAAFDAAEPAVAYNGTNNEYLVVFRGRDTSFVAGDVEVWAQRLNAATGAEVGSDVFKISTVGPSATGGFAGSHPDVAYNPLDNEYLVVWDSNHSTDPQQAGGQEIYGQRLAASTGAEVGADDFPFTDMGPETGPYRATDPAISFSTGLQEYYLVWAGQDDTPPYVGDETEIFSQRIARDGSEIETDTPLSDMGYPGDIRFDAALPAVASNQVNLWLVVWESDDTRYGSARLPGAFDMHVLRCRVPARY